MGRVLRLADDPRIKPPDFESFSERPVNYFREIMQDHSRPQTTSSTIQNVSLRVPEFETRKHAADIEKARSEGIELGKTQGWEIAQAELSPALELMQNYATMLAAERADMTARFEDQLVNLATQMASKILNAELSVKPELLANIVKNAFRSLGEARQVTVRVHPQDLSLLRERAEQIAESLSSSASLDMRPDESLSRGDCIVDSDIGSLDARLATQLETLKQQLDLSLGKSE